MLSKLIIGKFGPAEKMAGGGPFFISVFVLLGSKRETFDVYVSIWCEGTKASMHGFAVSLIQALPRIVIRVP